MYVSSATKQRDGHGHTKSLSICRYSHSSRRLLNREYDLSSSVVSEACAVLILARRLGPSPISVRREWPKFLERFFSPRLLKSKSRSYSRTKIALRTRQQAVACADRKAEMGAKTCRDKHAFVLDSPRVSRERRSDNVSCKDSLGQVLRHVQRYCRGQACRERVRESTYLRTCQEESLYTNSRPGHHVRTRSASRMGMRGGRRRSTFCRLPALPMKRLSGLSESSRSLEGVACSPRVWQWPTSWTVVDQSTE